MKRLAMAVIVVGGLVAIGCSAPASQPAASATPAAAAPPIAAPYTPVISLNQIMVSVVDSNSHKLWDVEQKAPTTPEEWAELEHSAVTLAAAGNLTLVSGNGANDRKWTQEPNWQKYSEGVSMAGLDAVAAVKNKDVAALKTAGDELVLTCINCHREYKLEVPKVWSDHEQVH